MELFIAPYVLFYFLSAFANGLLEFFSFSKSLEDKRLPIYRDAWH